MLYDVQQVSLEATTIKHVRIRRGQLYGSNNIIISIHESCDRAEKELNSEKQKNGIVLLMKMKLHLNHYKDKPE